VRKRASPLPPQLKKSSNSALENPFLGSSFVLAYIIGLACEECTTAIIADPTTIASAAAQPAGLPLREYLSHHPPPTNSWPHLCFIRKIKTGGSIVLAPLHCALPVTGRASHGLAHLAEPILAPAAFGNACSDHQQAAGHFRKSHV
jgi:hypothetical protein